MKTASRMGILNVQREGIADGGTGYCRTTRTEAREDTRDRQSEDRPQTTETQHLWYPPVLAGEVSVAVEVTLIRPADAVDNDQIEHLQR